jgi:hypothetical protein
LNVSTVLGISVRVGVYFCVFSYWHRILIAFISLVSSIST